MAFNTALSGLRAAQGDLSITGNNIANASTVGFKQSRAEFSDLYAASISGVSSRAIGNGTLLSNVGQQFNQGNISFTDNNLDLAINGNGFFILEDTSGAVQYSRSGIFGLDKDGFIVNNQGAKLQGFQVLEGEQLGGNRDELRISTENLSPQATGEVETTLNLNSESTSIANNGILPLFDPADPTTYTHATSSTIYDSLGNSHVLSQYYVRDDTVNQRFSLTGTAATGTLGLTDSSGATLSVDLSTATADIDGDGVADAMGTSTDNDGAILASYISNNVAGYTATYDQRNNELVVARQDGTAFTYASAGAAATLLGSASGSVDVVDNRWHLYVQVDGNNVGGIPDPTTGEATTPSLLRQEVIFNPDGSLNTINGTQTSSLSITNWDPDTGAVNASPFTLDLAGTTQFGSPFAVNSSSQDGYTTGRLVGVDIDDTGTVLARYSNGQSTVLGGVALANFNNPQGLTPVGDNAWTESFDSGSPIIGNPGTSSLGLVQSGALEDSNVDLSDELVNLILAQRNYQANAKTIETADALTQTIINIR